MNGQRIGYIRVSTLVQNDERQLEGIECDRTFIDHASGKDTRRPELESLLTFVRAGDTVTVHSMDRLARDLDELRHLVQDLTSRDITVEFVKEHLTFTGNDSPMARLMLSVMGAFSEFERELLKERQREGIALAKVRGVYRGRKRSLTPDSAQDIIRRIENGEAKSRLAKEYGISRETLYQYVKAANSTQSKFSPVVKLTGM